MSIYEFEEREIQLIGIAIRRQIKRLAGDIQNIQRKYKENADKEVISYKRQKMLEMRKIAQKLRFELDI